MNRSLPRAARHLGGNRLSAAAAARTFGSLSGLVVAAGRKPRKRIADPQIASTAVADGVALYTRNPDDFNGLGGLLNVVAM
ncbi:MAG: hypothetical protein ACRDXX_18205 [Stackebrandtia sp.]